MARLNERRCHIAFMDSRAQGLQEKIDALNKGEYLGVRKHNGATLHQLTRKASEHLKNYPFDVVYIIGGACDITLKNKSTKTISFPWAPPEDLSQHLISTLDAENNTMKEKHPAAKVVFCPLVGLELERVVNEHTVEATHQLIVDEAVFKFNTKIFDLNKKRGTFSPSLHRTVHRSSKGIMKSHYHHLDDGIHLSEELKDKWAAELVKATSIN